MTTKFHYRIEQILNRFRAEDVVDLIVGAEDVKTEKPNPEVYFGQRTTFGLSHGIKICLYENIGV